MAQFLSRLKRRGDFLSVAGKGRRFVTPGIVVQMWRRLADDNDVAAPVRYGLTASRRVGNAVQRNRARRRLRAAAEVVLPCHAVPGCDYVLVARTATLTRPFPQLIGDLIDAIHRLGDKGRRPVTTGGTGRTR